jgi:hypothetical protein
MKDGMKVAPKNKRSSSIRRVRPTYCLLPGKTAGQCPVSFKLWSQAVSAAFLSTME